MHFETLRTKINDRLMQLRTTHAKAQIDHFRWLYGALGAVPADVMFICENPSLAGVESAHVQTIDGKPPDIEAQWWGWPKNPAATRFRRVLCDLGLKSTQPTERGGWACYITNAIKEASIVKEHAKLPHAIWCQKVRAWADVLAWQIDAVSPRHVFCVGGNAEKAVALLQREHLLPRFPRHRIWHYSAPFNHAKVISEMRSGITSILRDENFCAERSR